ncbi:MAG: acyl-CoA desaturase [Candidatus Sumerlaeia bacterium]|nr:acyl-CoA desaturase [Candidatus Sumerlaeia bacterium]
MKKSPQSGTSGGILWSIARWLETRRSPDKRPTDENQDKKVDWIRVMPFIGTHLMCLGVIWVGWSWIAVLVAIFLYAIRMFAITGFYHRYFSHKTFKTSRFFQFIFALLGNSAAQRGPLWWAAHHRHHHRHSDDPDDPHSPHQHGLLWSHMLWFTNRSNYSTRLEYVKDLAKYPELRFIDRYDILVPILLGTFLFYFGVALNFFFPGLGTSGMQMLIWGFFISTVVLFHATCTINSLSHMIGRKRYDTGDESRNSLLLALLTFGEGWHNNHHYYPNATRQGFYWWEIDLTYYTLRLMAAFGIIWDMKGVPAHVRAKTTAGGNAIDPDTPPSPPNLQESV